MAEPKSKAELRATALAAREKLSDKQRTAAAGALAKRGLPIEIINGLIVSGYSPIRNEIDPEPLMRALASRGARLALPSVNARGKALTFRAWTPGDRLMMGMLGIPEPSTAAERAGGFERGSTRPVGAWPPSGPHRPASPRRPVCAPDALSLPV